MSDSFIEQNLDRANFERSADLEMDESNNTFKHAQLEREQDLERSDIVGRRLIYQPVFNSG